MQTIRSRHEPELITIPSADQAFRAHVLAIASDEGGALAGDLERRLRRIYPRLVVRERSLAGEPPAWYVYRDGGWRSSTGADWWTEPSMPRVAFAADGWLVEITRTAAGILGIEPTEAPEHHFTDFIVPGTLEDNLALFRAVGNGHALTATVLLRPASGDTIAIDLHATREGEQLIALFRLADDVDVDESVAAATSLAPPLVATTPETDVAFRSYVLRALERMPHPTPDGLALRLRRLYPHASVTLAENDGWLARRDPATAEADAAWWTDPTLPTVRYDAQALILEANQAARAFLGHELVGRHWQDFVTPGSTEQVSLMLEILADVGAAESRFRMPRADGSLVEFNSYTTVHGEEFVTVMRPQVE
ncbi:MAG TPA: PAS domain-containing protein [Candidatus Limnocylindrales bacterium]|nr:PAS domain-containing protein [Candidatus Limnocylindrales bacterium]